LLMETSDIIKKVRKIEIKTRGLSHAVFSGHYHSAFKGKGMTFSEVREYQYGDDIRNIDWNVTARFNHPYIKIFDEERELTVMLVIDVSASNEFGTRKQLKAELITEVAAVLAFSAINNNDKVGVVFFSDRIEKFIPPKKGKTHILRIIRELIDFQPKSQKTNISEGLRFLTNAIKKRCITFLISDFQDTNFDQALRIASRKHDIVAVRTYDRRETELPKMGMVKVLNKETGRSIWVDTNDPGLRSNYSSHWAKQERDLSVLFKRLGIDSAIIPTGDDYVRPLVNLFKVRESRY
jgi:uncharacterized protein (DUF58 family)